MERSNKGKRNKIQGRNNKEGGFQEQDKETTSRKETEDNRKNSLQDFKI